MDFFTEYLAYTSGGEVPVTFNRWSAIAGLSAILERSIYTPYGHSEIHPNIYCMLIGSAGTRKSTAIKLVKKLLLQSGYTSIAAERTSKEKFLADLSHQDNTDPLDEQIFGETSESAVTPSFIAADEANDFFGIGNVEFLSVLGSLWDWTGKYENKIKTGKSDWIPNPTITILSGNTPTGFSLAFPSTILGQGFFSRLLLVYGEPNGKRITFPRTPSKDETQAILQRIAQIKSFCSGEWNLTPTAINLVDKIYQTYKPPQDPRFESYSNRRITHLLKLAQVVSAARMERGITEECIVQTNTYLTYIESLMPKALGEFGKAKDSDITHRVLSIIEATERPIPLKSLWVSVSSELDKIQDLSTIIQKLLFANKIQTVNAGFLPIRRMIDHEDYVRDGVVDFERFLTHEELEIKK